MYNRKSIYIGVEGRMKAKKNGNSLMVLFIIILAVLLVSILWMYSNAPKSAESVEVSGESEVSSESVDSLEESEVLETKVEEDTLIETELAENPYQDYFLANEHMVAWLKVEGTPIDYPAMQTMFDEEYYLYLNFDQEEDKNGSLLVDTDSSIQPASSNIIIHGHNMKSGAMFACLFDYEDQDFAKEHSIISLYTREEERRYEVISVFSSKVFYTTDTDFKYYKFFQADTQEEFDDWYTNIMQMSLIDTGVTASLGDEFITLSTCAYDVENGRFVVVGKRIEDGPQYAAFEEKIDEVD